MNNFLESTNNIRELIDDLKSVCANYGLGNDGNEFKIITQIFLYKFLNDKFIYEIKNINEKIKSNEDLEKYLFDLNDNDYELLTIKLSEGTAVLKQRHFISSLFSRQNQANFADTFDKTLMDVAIQNRDIFSVTTGGGEKIALFENISKYISDNRDDFCRAIINKLVRFSFEDIFGESFDFFATIFEYLIKDYNSDSGGKYAEYFTPHSVSGIIASCLVPNSKENQISNVTCYDPSAGSGSLLMNLAHHIGVDKCTIFSQDISQKSSNLLRLNLILNNLVHSIHNIIQGNTLLTPYHKERNGALKKFDFVVSNPPFKLDFSEYRDDLEIKENNNTFFAGIPNIPNKKKESMSIYLVFLQHVISSLKSEGRAAVVVPTGFVSAQSGIALKIRKRLIDEKMLSGVISMPSNIFATTGTNVSIIFINKATQENVLLVDASNLGQKVKEGKNQKTVLNSSEIKMIINSFCNKLSVEDFSISVPFDDISQNKYSFSPGQYFDVKINYTDISQEEFKEKISLFESDIEQLYQESFSLKKNISTQIKNINLKNINQIL